LIVNNEVKDMFKQVTKSLYLSDNGEWRVGTRGTKQPTVGKIGAKEIARYEGTEFRKHYWIAKLFVPNPQGFQSAKIINVKKPITSSNVKWIRGHNCTLNEKTVHMIKLLLTQGKLTGTEIAKHFNVNRSTISRIKTGKRWL
tara:strand:- start:315 stop:740 length:426 start_codon:yes stop_codon:yes gene_type:complete